MKSTILRLVVSLVLVLSIALAYGVNFDTAEAGGKGKGGQNKEKGGPNLFWD